MNIQDHKCSKGHSILFWQLSSHQGDNAINLPIALGQVILKSLSEKEKPERSELAPNINLSVSTNCSTNCCF